MTSFLDFWGSGNARMRSLAPSTRIACGAIVFACCLIAPLGSPLGVFIACGAAICWVLLCGIRWRGMAGLALYACLLFLPLFLLTPWIETRPSPAGNWLSMARVPLEIGIRGAACLFVCASTIAVLDLAELNTGLSRLPIPRAAAGLIVQIVHQTAMLTNESRRIASAVRVRGAPSGLMARLVFLPALPTIWLLRITNRAERLAAAMEVRGFDPAASAPGGRLAFLDAIAVAMVILLLGATVAIRWLDVL